MDLAALEHLVHLGHRQLLLDLLDLAHLAHQLDRLLQLRQPVLKLRAVQAVLGCLACPKALAHQTSLKALVVPGPLAHRLGQMDLAHLGRQGVQLHQGVQRPQQLRQAPKHLAVREVQGHPVCLKVQAVQ